MMHHVGLHRINFVYLSLARLLRDYPKFVDTTFSWTRPPDTFIYNIEQRQVFRDIMVRFNQCLPKHCMINDSCGPAIPATQADICDFKLPATDIGL